MPSLALPITRAAILAPRPVVAAPPGGTFTPPSTNLVLWLEADKLALSDGALVASWTDSSPLANHATHVNPANQPTYRATGGPNGLPTVEFTGSDRLLTTSNIPLTGQAVTFYVVASSSVDGTDQIIIELGSNYNAQTAGFVCFRQSSNKAYSGIKGNAGFNDMTSVANLQSVPKLIATVIDRSLTGSETSQYLNGTIGTFGSVANNTDSFGSALALNVGGRLNDTALLTGKIALVLVYNAAHDTTTRQTIQTGINAKYGLF